MTEKLKSWYFQLLSAGIVAILVIIPLLPKLPLFNVSKTSVAIRLEDFVLALMALLFLPLALKRIRRLLSDTLVLAVLGFWVIGFFSTFSAIFITQSVVSHLAILNDLRRIEYMMPLLLVLTLKPSESKLKEYLVILFFVSLVVAIYAVGQIYAGFPVFSTANTEFAKGIPLSLGPGARINSTFAGHYDLAAYSAIMLSIIGAFLFNTGFSFAGSRGKATKVGLFLLAAANLWILLQTASRISFVAYLVGITLVLVVLKKRIILILVLIVSLLSLLSSDEIKARFFDTFKYGIKTLSYTIQPQPAFAQRARAISSAIPASQSATPMSYQDTAPGEPQNPQQIGVFRSSRVRFDFEWPAAVNGFLRNPILGSGYSSLGLATDNDYLRSLGEVGIFGSAAFSLIFVEIGKRVSNFIKKTKESNFAKTLVIGITGAACALLINATFIDVFEASKIVILFWTLVGILVVTIKQSNENFNKNN